MVTIPQGKVIYRAGQKVDTFYIIRKGSVSVTYPGGSYMLQSGDVIGLCEIGNGITGAEYSAKEEVEALNYPFGAAQMRRLFDNSNDVMRWFLASYFRQLNEIIGQCRRVKEEGENLKKGLRKNYETFCALCEKYQMKAGKISDETEAVLLSVKEDIPVWLQGFYGTLERLIRSWEYQKTEYDFIYGFFAKASADIRGILSLSQKLYTQQKTICRQLLGIDEEGFLDALFLLYERMVDGGNESGDVLFVRSCMDDMLQQYERRGGNAKAQKERIVERIREIESGERTERKEEEPESRSAEATIAKETLPEPTAEQAVEKQTVEGSVAEEAVKSPEEPVAIERMEEEPVAEEMAELPEELSEELPEEPIAEPIEETTEEPVVTEQSMEEPAEDLSHSLDVILEFANCNPELSEAFKAHVEQYKKMPNKNGTEDDIRALRQKLTKEFNQVYADAFLSSIGKEVPKIVRMFFTFGYVDETLAGKQNTVWLYNMVDRLPTDPERGVYTFYQWLQEVYAQRKEPSRNEFDTDYMGYLIEQKRMGNITAEEQKELLNDSIARVKFELENLFPTVNKITYGRIATFCPLFAEHNVLKPMDTMLVSTDKIFTILQGIREKDYGAYYRETMYSNPEAGIPKEVIHIEVLPDFILMPNAGTRGVMWQEIEGKRRSTPARMLSSIFQIEDLETILIRLTGEFRWEMCKRIQGARWNDLSEKSLTSEYFDYIQFYKRNSELSADTKEKIKTDLGRTKNNFKEMFLRDYLLWIMFESNSSPRLNKVARGIFFNYCTFTSAVRQKLRANPLYQEMVDRGEIKMKQKRHKMENICQKLSAQGKEIPEEIRREMEFMEM